MSHLSSNTFNLEDELVKYVLFVRLYLFHHSISNVWSLLAGETTKQETPKATIPSPTEPRISSPVIDETTTVGSGRSMSIFESFDEMCLSPQLIAAISPARTPALAPVPSMAFSLKEFSLLIEQTSPVMNDRLNAEASAQIKEHGRKGNLPECWRVWNNLEASPNEITLGCMIDALVSCREVRQAESLVNQWKDRVKPNTVVYSTLIHGWAKENDSKRALAIFNQMRSERVVCNAVTYNCVIHACVRSGDMQGSLDLLREMKASGSVRPDKFTYSTIIKGYCSRGEIDSALFLFDEMMREKLAPDLVIYNTLLDGCVKTRHPEVCDELLEDMISKWRIYPNSYTLSILIKRFGRQGDLARALELVDLWPKRFGFKANAHVWTCLISACVTHGRLHTAECIFASMKGDSAGVVDLMSRNLEVSSSSELKLLSNAVLMASACPADAKTYETLALGYLRYSDPVRALELVIEGKGLSSQCVSQVAQTAVQYGLDISPLVRGA
jgi:pentatricopeptide repeat protein